MCKPNNVWVVVQVDGSEERWLLQRVGDRIFKLVADRLDSADARCLCSALLDQGKLPVMLMPEETPA